MSDIAYLEDADAKTAEVQKIKAQIKHSAVQVYYPSFVLVREAGPPANIPDRAHHSLKQYHCFSTP